ncbi:MAG TPA: threonine/serine dehydratase [Verrucomicrobiae bacterium]|nr:threonine/serine dehydratase [Verrucomicrobiae bacterium]
MKPVIHGVSPERIQATEQLIRPYIRRTPVITCSGADFGLDSVSLVFKLELLQHAGSFKARGAFANLLRRPVPEAGVVAATGGNHGVAVAFAARSLNKRATIFVPGVSSAEKVAKIRSYGAELVITGERYADALAASELHAAKTGALRVHAYDQVETLLGQGTLALEFEQQAQDLDTLLIAVGGGGLIGGVAAWYASRIAKGEIKIIGVEPETAPTLTYAFKAGRPVDSPAGGIAADSLAPRQVGALMFPIAQEFVSNVALVTDESIQQAQEALWSVLRVAAEPGGAAAFAALLSRRYVPRPGERVGVVICGGNTTAVNFKTTPTASLEPAEAAAR